MPNVYLYTFYHIYCKYTRGFIEFHLFYTNRTKIYVNIEQNIFKAQKVAAVMHDSHSIVFQERKDKPNGNATLLYCCKRCIEGFQQVVDVLCTDGKPYCVRLDTLILQLLLGELGVSGGSRVDYQ